VFERIYENSLKLVNGCSLLHPSVLILLYWLHFLQYGEWNKEVKIWPFW